METNFSGYCLYQEIGRVVVCVGISVGIPTGMGMGIEIETSRLQQPWKSAPRVKKTTLRTPSPAVANS